MMSRRSPFMLSLIGSIIALVQSATADFSIIELEPNDTLQTAQPLPSIPPPVLLDLASVQGSISPGDVDFFQIVFPEPAAVSAFLTQGASTPHLLAIFDAEGNLLDADETFVVSGPLSPGAYTLAVTGATDAGFLGAHNESFKYVLINWLPSAGAAPMVAIGALFGRSRRRRS